MNENILTELGFEPKNKNTWVKSFDNYEVNYFVGSNTLIVTNEEKSLTYPIKPMTREQLEGALHNIPYKFADELC